MVAELTHRERVRAQEGLMLLTRKRSGSVKGRLAYNGKDTHDWISKDNTSSPTVGTDSIMMTVAVDTYERRDVMTSDVPNTFIQTDAPEKEIGERFIMKIRGKLVDWLVDLDPGEYENLVIIENYQKVIYLLIQKAICGILKASLL